jgi:hypothetical protein
LLLIKLTADDLRLFERTKTDSEKIGLFSLLQDRIEQAKTLKSFGKTVKEDVEKYGWQKALKCARDIMGDAVTVPPYPDPGWYQRINGVLRQNAFTDEFMTTLTNYCKANLMNGRKTISFDFMVCQHRRILDGEFGAGKAAIVARGQRPDVTLYQLPEE